MFDPVTTRNFYRSRSGRLLARLYLMLAFGCMGWVISDTPRGMLWSLLPVPLFVRWRRRPTSRFDAGLDESFKAPCSVPGPSLPAASPPPRDFKPPPSPPG